MARPYSVDLRERVVRAVEPGHRGGRQPELRDQADATLASPEYARGRSDRRRQAFEVGRAGGACATGRPDM